MIETENNGKYKKDTHVCCDKSLTETFRLRTQDRIMARFVTINAICRHVYLQKALAVLIVSRKETKGMLSTEVPYMLAIFSKL